MKLIEFVAAVRNHAAMDSTEAALSASRATLITIGEHLQGEEPRHLAAQLPPELAAFLRSGSRNRGERLSAQEFLRRISEREGVDLETARAHARAVVETLQEAVCEAEQRLEELARAVPPSMSRQ